MGLGRTHLNARFADARPTILFVSYVTVVTSMLEKLLIQNFQAHERIKIEFDPKVTTIVGDNDVGKSSIIRALKWVCLNKSPKGQYIRHGKRGTSVKLYVDGHKVGRSKSSSLNAYSLDDAEFKSFGTKVPDPILNLLNVDEVSFQGQHDGPFWFTLTAGEVSRRLNAIVDLSVIDESLSAIANRCRRKQHAVEIAQERLEKSKGKKESLKWAIDADRQYRSVEEAERKADNLAVCCDALSAEMESAQQRIEAVREAERACESGQKVIDAGRAYGALRKQYERLSSIIESAQHHEFLKNREIPDFDGISEAWANYHACARRMEKLDKTMEVLSCSRNRIEAIDESLKEAELELKGFIGNKCPTCGQEVRDDAVRG